MKLTVSYFQFTFSHFIVILFWNQLWTCMDRPTWRDCATFSLQKRTRRLVRSPWPIEVYLPARDPRYMSFSATTELADTLLKKLSCWKIIQDDVYQRSLLGGPETPNCRSVVTGIFHLFCSSSRKFELDQKSTHACVWLTLGSDVLNVAVNFHLNNEGESSAPSTKKLLRALS